MLALERKLPGEPRTLYVFSVQAQDGAFPEQKSVDFCPASRVRQHAVGEPRTWSPGRAEKTHSVVFLRQLKLAARQFARISACSCIGAAAPAQDAWRTPQAGSVSPRTDVRGSWPSSLQAPKPPGLQAPTELKLWRMAGNRQIALALPGASR